MENYESFHSVLTRTGTMEHLYRQLLRLNDTKLMENKQHKAPFLSM